MAMTGDKIRLTIEANPEIHPAVDADKIRARRAEAYIEEDIRETARAAAKLRRANARERNKKAGGALLIRTGIAAALVLALYLAELFGLIVTGLVIPLVCVVFVWLAFWFGAWTQFVFCRGGLLK